MFQTIHKLTSLALVAVATLGLGATARADFTVSKSQRAVLVFIANLEQGSPAQRAFYDFVEFGAAGVSHLALDAQYGSVTYVEGANARRLRLINELDDITDKSGIKAVDLIFVTHGLTGAVQFSDGTVAMSTLAQQIKTRLGAKRTKLRAVYSTACFGASHLSSWRSAGFKVASGSRKVHADSEVSYPAYLVVWRSGGTFGQAVAAANAADIGDLFDAAARLVLTLAGSPSSAALVDSHRLISGASQLRINTML